MITLVPRLISDRVSVCASLGLNADSLSNWRNAAYLGLADAISWSSSLSVGMYGSGGVSSLYILNS